MQQSRRDYEQIRDMIDNVFRSYDRNLAMSLLKQLTNQDVLTICSINNSCQYNIQKEYAMYFTYFFVKDTLRNFMSDMSREELGDSMQALQMSHNFIQHVNAICDNDTYKKCVLLVAILKNKFICDERDIIQ